MLCTGASASAQDSFFVYRNFFSDDLSAWNEKILDVAQAGADVRVRFVQISLANRSCPGLLVQAVEKTLPGTTVRKVADMNVCALSPRDVRRAVSEAERPGIHTETASQVIATHCGKTDRLLEFPFDADLDFEKLSTWDPRVKKLSGMIYDISRRTFGESFWFRDDEQQPAREELGLALIPHLTSGKYDNVLGERVEELKKYKRPPPIGERGPIPSLVDAQMLHLARFVAPVYPSIAESARVQGDVPLKIRVDRRSGVVTDVELNAGNEKPAAGIALLSPAAIDAARKWQFAPEFLAGDTIDATVRFSLQCEAR